MTPSGEIAAASEANHELRQGVKLRPSFTPSPNLKPTKDGFDSSSSSIPSFPRPSPSSLESFRSSSWVRSLRFPTPPYYHQKPSSGSPLPLGLQIPSSESFPSSRWVRSLSFPTLPYKYNIPRPSYASPSPGELRITSPAANIKQGLIECWKPFLSFPKRVFIEMKEPDEKLNLEDINPILWCIEKYAISKNFLVAVGVAVMAALMFSNIPGINKTGTHIAAATLPVSFATLLIGLLFRKRSIKYSFLSQLLGIGMAIFALSASGFSFLNKGFKWIPVVTGVVCLGILVMPVTALISYERRSGKDKDPEIGN